MYLTERFIMTPDQWLSLVLKDALDPTTTTTDEFNTLRTNYTVWKAAIENLILEEKNRFFSAQTRLLNFKKLSIDDWNDFQAGNWMNYIPESDHEEFKIVYANWRARLQKLHDRKVKIAFYKTFDEAVKKSPGETLPAEVSDMVWKSRAGGLIEAITEHRRAYVLANKQPNGIDFELWRCVDLCEFNASQHKAIQDGRRIAFSELVRSPGHVLKLPHIFPKSFILKGL